MKNDKASHISHRVIIPQRNQNITEYKNFTNCRFGAKPDETGQNLSGKISAS